MIDFEWYRPGTEIPTDVQAQLREMLADAAEADAEAGFPALSLDDHVEHGTSHLVVWLLADDRSGSTGPLVPSVASYLRVEPGRGADAGIGLLSYVVRPEYRSRGITTLLLEKIGLDMGQSDEAGEGWQGTGVSAARIWALGNHPAALRMSLRFRRFGIRTALRQWQLLIPLREGRDIDPGAEPGGPDVRLAVGAADRAAADRLWTAADRRRAQPERAEVLVAGSVDNPEGALWVDPMSGERTEYGTAGRVVAVHTRDSVAADAAPREQDPLTRALLVRGLERLRDAGIRVGAITVDSRDRALVHETRSLGFIHDRTDVQYAVSGATDSPRRSG